MAAQQMICLCKHQVDSLSDGERWGVILNPVLLTLSSLRHSTMAGSSNAEGWSKSWSAALE